MGAIARGGGVGVDAEHVSLAVLLAATVCVKEVTAAAAKFNK